VQLEAGQLDGQHVIRIGVQNRLEQRRADVPRTRGAQPGRAQDTGEHLDRRRLAVGAGDRDPGRGTGLRAHTPRKLHLTPDRYAARGRGEQEGVVGAKTW